MPNMVEGDVSHPGFDGLRRCSRRTAFAIIALAVPRDKLGRSLGIQGTAQALGLSLGPPIGGFLIVAGGWRLILLVNLPPGVFGAIAAWYLISAQPRAPAASAL